MMTIMDGFETVATDGIYLFGDPVAKPLADYSAGAAAGKLAVAHGADGHSTIAAPAMLGSI